VSSEAGAVPPPGEARGRSEVNPDHRRPTSAPDGRFPRAPGSGRVPREGGLRTRLHPGEEQPVHAGPEGAV
ncbi:MAG: hypothetical protein AVDCRST_MAG36-1633, partial [uncultured Nocardioidaceae bacterium]